jgi:type IV pilus assembly protein PilP
MKKIKLVFLNTIIIIFITAFFAYAVEVKKASTSIAPASVKVAPAAKQTPIQNPASPAPAANVTPVAPNSIKNPTLPAPVPASTTAPVDNYSYNPSGKPDPFRPFIIAEILEKKKIETKEKEKEKKAVLSIFPLQRAETEKYRVVGIAGDKDHRVAVVEDTAKKFYPLLIGTRIGLSNGKVIEIMADRVIVEENENKKTKRIILKLRKN